ncbi:hypothetical protein CEXT_117021 [Caerostris extrusa]|uniref:Uncharacterized protein n=1 Tax=Caerostris extrusa TaxID=172846 RepID=A0AAV4P6I8_CAEEX|nr:hypothetical protein CEXT_117021 [Caerostris extrusa]
MNSEDYQAIKNWNPDSAVFGHKNVLENRETSAPESGYKIISNSNHALTYCVATATKSPCKFLLFAFISIHSIHFGLSLSCSN